MLCGWWAPTLQDQYDCIDLSDNQIQHLGNFARLERLVTLLLNNNVVNRVEATIGKQLPNLETLVLTNCRVASLTEIDAIASLKKLRTSCGGVCVGVPMERRSCLRGWWCGRTSELVEEPCHTHQELPVVHHPQDPDLVDAGLHPCEAEGTPVQPRWACCVLGHGSRAS